MKMARDMEIEIRSPFLINEMQSLETDSMSQSFRTTYGGHDDRVMSLGFIIISLYQYEPNRPQASTKPTQHMIDEAKASGKVAPKRYARYMPSDQERDSQEDPYGDRQRDAVTKRIRESMYGN